MDCRCAVWRAREVKASEGEAAVLPGGVGGGWRIEEDGKMVEERSDGREEKAMAGNRPCSQKLKGCTGELKKAPERLPMLG